MGYFVLAFVALVDVFALLQLVRAIRHNKITTPSSGFRTKDRYAQPFGFWGSVTYYVVCLLGSVYAGVAFWFGPRP